MTNAHHRAAEGRRVAVVTGASAGIGAVVAADLVSRGWHVIGLGRDPARCAAAERDISAAAGPGGRFDMIRADLSSMADTARAAEEIAALTDRVHVLANNAGGLARDRLITPEGLEACFAGNHLGPFLLTLRLLPLLRRAAAGGPPGSARIINTSSSAGENAPPFDWNDLQNIAHFEDGSSYRRAKLANVLVARGLAKRFGGEGIAAYSVDPGTVTSNFITHGTREMQALIRSLPAVTPQEGADTILWLATMDAPPADNGGYYCRRAPKAPNVLAKDDAVIDRLWAESERLLAAIVP